MLASFIKTSDKKKNKQTNKAKQNKTKDKKKNKSKKKKKNLFLIFQHDEINSKWTMMSYCYTWCRN